MNLEPSTIIAGATWIAGMGATWAVLGYRIKELEKTAAAAKALHDADLVTAVALRAALDACDAKIEYVRKEHGGRIGEVTILAKELGAELRVLERYTTTGKRSRTAAGGHAIPKAIE